jgi:nicotinate-nucleotide adenylyltransferase
MKIGIFGGTFDPPHFGHLIVAEHVRDGLGLDRILFIPAVIPPHKLQRSDITPADMRLEMVRLAIEGNGSFEVSDIEIRRGGLSYTVDTLKELRTQRPTDDLYLLMGMDNLRDFYGWKDPEMIRRIAHIVVMTRPGFEAKSMSEEDRSTMTICDVPEIEISSREIRRRVRQRHSIQYLVPTTVLDFITKNDLYHG